MTYKYRCSNNHEFTYEQKIIASPLKECLKCGNYCARVPFTGEEANGVFTINGYKEENGYS